MIQSFVFVPHAPPPPPLKHPTVVAGTQVPQPPKQVTWADAPPSHQTRPSQSTNGQANYGDRRLAVTAMQGDQQSGVTPYQRHQSQAYQNQAYPDQRYLNKSHQTQKYNPIAQSTTPRSTKKLSIGPPHPHNNVPGSSESVSPMSASSMDPKDDPSIEPNYQSKPRKAKRHYQSFTDAREWSAEVKEREARQELRAHAAS